MLIDPNRWSKDGATALAEWEPTEQDGPSCCLLGPGRRHRLAHGQGARRRDRAGYCRRGQMGRSSPASTWAKDGRGFYYSRFPSPQTGRRYPVAERESAKSTSTSSARRSPPTGWSTRRPSEPELTSWRRGHATTAAGWSSPRRTAPTTAIEVTLIDLNEPGREAAHADPRLREQLDLRRQPRVDASISSPTRARRA